MGNISRKPAVPDAQTGLRPRQVKLIQSTWQTFCSGNREYGLLVFLSLFAQHPELLALFPKFRDSPVATLKDDPAFRAHGCAIGYHLSAMVASLEDAAALEVMAQRQAAEHLKRDGVEPAHFGVIGGCIVDVMRAKHVRDMTAEATEAWGKFFTYLVGVIKAQYDEAAARGAEASSMEWNPAADVTLDSGSIAAASVTGSHVVSPKKQPYSALEPVAERTEGATALQAADRPTAVPPMQDATTAPACKPSPEKGPHNEAERERSAQEKSAQQLDVHKSDVPEKVAPESGHEHKFLEMVERKELATN